MFQIDPTHRSTIAEILGDDWMVKETIQADEIVGIVTNIIKVTDEKAANLVVMRQN